MDAEDRRRSGRVGSAAADPDAPNRKSHPPVARDFPPVAVSHSSGPETAKVSHCASEPESMPVVNHRTRCSDEPCVQVSELTPLPERCWMWIASGALEEGARLPTVRQLAGDLTTDRKSVV